MKSNYLFIIMLVSCLCSVSCGTKTKIAQTITNFYTSDEIVQQLQERFLHESEALKIKSLFILDGIPYQKATDTITAHHTIDDELKKYDKNDIRTVYYVDAKKNRIGCGSIDYDIIPLILTNEVKQKRKLKKRVLMWIQERYFSGQYAINTRPLVIFNRKPLTTKIAFQVLQTLKVGHIDFMQKYEESQVIAGFEHISKNGVVEIFTK